MASCGTLNKLSLNNQIVSMRHDVRRAKLYTINRNVKEARLLKKRHGTEEQKNKFIRKSNRLIEEVKVIKALKDDEVSKFLLTQEEDLLSVLNDPQQELKTKAMFKICMNSLLKASLFEFKKKYPNWSTEVPLLLSQLGRKIKRNKSGNSKESTCKASDSDFSLKKKGVKLSHDTIVINTPGNNEFSIEKIKGKEGTEESLEKVGKPKNKKIKINDFGENKMDKEFIQNNKCNKKQPESKKIDCELLESKEKVRIQNKETKVVDPFFVTSDNNEYLTVATSEKQIEALKNVVQNMKNKTDSFSSFQRQDNNSKNLYGSKKFKSQDENNFGRKHFNGKYGFQEKIGKEKNYNNKFNIDNKRLKTKGSNNISVQEEKLHPSWEAKKKLSGLSQFTGKKIVFNDDD